MKDVIKNKISSLQKQYENAPDDDDSDDKIINSDGKTSIELSLDPKDVPVMNKSTINRIIGKLQLTDYMINLLNDN